MTTPEQRLESIAEDFAFLEDWEEKFRHIIDLGRELAPLEEQEKSAITKVQGCTSQVWIICEFDSSNNIINIRGNSDSSLVQGLLAILISIYSGSAPKMIIELEGNRIFETLDLADSLTPNRSGGMLSMMNRIREFAAEHLPKSGSN